MRDRLCLLAVHAHPDDEASKGAGTIARYHAEGVHTVLVTATGGEEGEILNPSFDTAEVRADIGAIRRRELAAAAAVIGYDEVVLLGYRDSGMADTPANTDPRCFAQAPLAEAVGRLVAEIRRVRPQVIVTYPDEQSRYRHPDHLRVHEISVVAFDAAGDPAAFPRAGEAYQPEKLYFTVWSLEQTMRRHEKFLELGIDSPYAEWFEDGWPNRVSEVAPTARIDVREYYDARRGGLLAHATQIDPSSPFWFGLPEDVDRALYAADAYVCARSLVGPIGEEDDLFAGIREKVTASGG
ncbi:MAG: PIG-L family deacetylase [Acidimicrobiales bacterium]